MYVCNVFCPEAGPSLDMHYQGSTSQFTRQKKGVRRGLHFTKATSEPVALWEYLSLHTLTHKSAANTTTKHPHTPNSSQTVTPINGTEPSWELQILL